MLFSLGACQEITTKAFANAMGVPLTRVSVQLKGHIDLRGFFAVDDSVRAGLNKNLGLKFGGCFCEQKDRRNRHVLWVSTELKAFELFSRKFQVGKRSFED